MEKQKANNFHKKSLFTWTVLRAEADICDLSLDLEVDFTALITLKTGISQWAINWRIYLNDKENDPSSRLKERFEMFEHNN